MVVLMVVLILCRASNVYVVKDTNSIQMEKTAFVSILCVRLLA